MNVVQRYILLWALLMEVSCLSTIAPAPHAGLTEQVCGARVRAFRARARLALRLRGGAVHDYADLSASTPPDEPGLDNWSYQSSSGPGSPGPAEQPDSEDSSTGLGIHNRNWSHIKALGLPVFEIPELAKVAKEARLLRHAADGAYEAQGYRMEEKKANKEEYERRKAVAKRGKELGWFEKGEGEKIEGEPCAKCHKILCTCEYEKEQEQMRKRGYEDPFERIKDRGILQPGRDFLPSSSTPSAEIDFWDKVERRGGSPVLSPRVQPKPCLVGLRACCGSAEVSCTLKLRRTLTRTRKAVRAICLMAMGTLRGSSQATYSQKSFILQLDIVNTPMKLMK